jgi:hypothetical protein
MRSLSSAPASPGDSSRLKGATTVQRHRQERRDDKLDEIRAQIANGTLVVRQMTLEEREAASQAAHLARARNGERAKLWKELRKAQSD